MRPHRPPFAWDCITQPFDMNIWIGSFHVNVGYRSMSLLLLTNQLTDNLTATYFTPGVICTPLRVQRIHAARSILPSVKSASKRIHHWCMIIHLFAKGTTKSIRIHRLHWGAQEYRTMKIVTATKNTHWQWSNHAHKQMRTYMYICMYIYMYIYTMSLRICLSEGNV